MLSQAGSAAGGAEGDDAETMECDEAGTAAGMECDDPGAVPFFFLDAHYEPAQLGTVFLVGKVKREGKFVSACAVVHGIKQCIFIVPKALVFADPDGELAGCASSLPRCYADTLCRHACGGVHCKL